METIILITIFIVFAKLTLLLFWCLSFCEDETESIKKEDTVERNAYADIYFSTSNENHHTTESLHRIIRDNIAENNGTNPPSYFELECDKLPSYASLYPSN